MPWFLGYEVSAPNHPVENHDDSFQKSNSTFDPDACVSLIPREAHLHSDGSKPSGAWTDNSADF